MQNAEKTIKNVPTAFRFDATVKAALALLADREGRSMANMLEWLIKKQCEREGMGWPPAVTQPSAPKKASAAGRQKAAARSAKN